jgi:hypothetical protein
MRKLAYLFIILLVFAAIFGTLVAVNWMGLGDTLYNSAEGSLFMPIRATVIANWLAVGNSGIAWIFLSSFIQGIVWSLFFVFVCYELFWQKGIQKLRGKTTTKTNKDLGTFTPQTSPATPEAAPIQVKEPAQPEQPKEEVTA